MNRSKQIVYGVVLLLVVILGWRLLGKGNRDLPTTSSNQVEVKAAKQVKDINQELSFPLMDKDGKEVSRWKMVIEKAEIRDEIVVQGKKTTSIKGRTFLILSLRLKNDYKKAIEVNTKDYVRLSVNGNLDDWLAPDVHNDPVEVQAISTKLTRVGFPISETDKDFVLQIGGIEGEKQRIELNFGN